MYFSMLTQFMAVFNSVCPLTFTVQFMVYSTKLHYFLQINCKIKKNLFHFFIDVLILVFY